MAVERLNDPADHVLDWEDVERPATRQIKSSAAKALATIDSRDRARLIAAIDRLAHEPSAGAALKRRRVALAQGRGRAVTQGSKESWAAVVEVMV